MKKMVGSLFGIIAVSLVGVTARGLRIKNDAQNEVYFALAVGDELPGIVKTVSGVGFQMIEPGDSKSQVININEPVYIAVWESPSGLGTLEIVPVSTSKGAGRVFNVTPTALYTFKKGTPIDVVWTGQKLEPRGRMTKGDLQSITVIP